MNMVNLSSKEFGRLQEMDTTLDKLRQRIDKNSAEKSKQWGTEMYYIDKNNGLMNRKFTSSPEKGSVVHKQLMLPLSLC